MCTSDCGLFSLAFATSLCAGVNPADEFYTQSDFRVHFSVLKTGHFQRKQERIKLLFFITLLWKCTALVGSQNTVE